VLAPKRSPRLRSRPAAPDVYEQSGENCSALAITRHHSQEGNVASDRAEVRYATASGGDHLISVYDQNTIMPDGNFPFDPNSC
jgi:hypothetical protein